MNDLGDKATRIVDFKKQVKVLSESIIAMCAERDTAPELVDQMREQVEDAGNAIEQWKDAFDMVRDDQGDGTFKTGEHSLAARHVALLEEH